MLTAINKHIARNARIHPLAFSIWRTGIVPHSWAMQMPPDFLPEAGDAVAAAASEAVRIAELDSAMAEQIAAAEKLLNAQGRTLFGQEDAEQ